VVSGKPATFSGMVNIKNPSQSQCPGHILRAAEEMNAPPNSFISLEDVMRNFAQGEY